MDNWKIVELKIAGKSNKEIAKQLKRAQPSIFWALRRMGFPDGTWVTVCYSFGEVFDKLALRRLHEISGFNVTEFAKRLGVPFATLWAGLRGKKQLHFNTARKASQWRQSLFSHLMSNATRNPGRQTTKYSQSRVIATFSPNLRERYSFLLEVLHRLAKKLRENPEWSRDELQQYLCEEARGEKAGRTPGDLFRRRFLPWAPELMPFLARKFKDLRGVHHQPLAYEIMAGPLGTTAPIISEVINPAQAQNIRPIPPEQMRWMILSRDNQPKPEAPKTKKRGPEPLGEEEKQYFKIGAAVETEIPSGLENDKHSIVEARRRVVARTRLQYDAVAQYHAKYRRLIKKQPLITIPA